MGRLFGTDGVRGVANRDLTPDLVLVLGRAAGNVLAPGGGEVVVGRDTRLSGPMLEAALVAGLCSAGANVRLAGVIPTPAIAWLAVDDKAAAGAVVSASHNPVPDNGIKFFSAEGFKVATAIEDEIEASMASPETQAGPGAPAGAGIGDAAVLPDALDRYEAYLLGALDSRLDGLKVVLDCAYGSAWEAAPRVFSAAGAAVVALHAEPDGARINVDCGSTDLSAVRAAVHAEGADFGLAFDGDADRVMAIDDRGEEVDGDRIIAMSALALLESGELTDNLVVATVMTNLGFKRALEASGIEVVTAPVGDRYVAEEMAARGALLGGEQSGHVIFARHSTTGDGILTGLKVAAHVVAKGRPLSELAHVFEPFPQRLVNVRVRSRDELDRSEVIWDEVRAAEAALGADGRVLLRASGTEPVVRVMVEAADPEVAERTAGVLAEVVTRELGA